jgi:mono/diheme cytochrome c family protein
VLGTLTVLGLAVALFVASRMFFAGDPVNPTSATVDSIARGTRLYTNNCSACHGVNARGGGPMAGTTAVPPPALTGSTSHLGGRTDGELFRIIVNGQSGGMPAWGGKLSDNEIWDVVNFLRSLDRGGEL